VLLAFDSIEKARAWNESPSAQETTAARMKSTDSLRSSYRALPTNL
jgi:uncharacterized protein (DUF1330 family)